MRAGSTLYRISPGQIGLSPSQAFMYHHCTIHLHIGIHCLRRSFIHYTIHTYTKYSSQNLPSSAGSSFPGNVIFDRVVALSCALCLRRESCRRRVEKSPTSTVLKRRIGDFFKSAALQNRRVGVIQVVWVTFATQPDRRYHPRIKFFIKQSHLKSSLVSSHGAPLALTEGWTEETGVIKAGEKSYSPGFWLIYAIRCGE